MAGLKYQSGFLDYETPQYGFDKPIPPSYGGGGGGTAGGGLPALLAPAAIGAIGTYFSARAQAKSEERNWRRQLELERMRIEAEKELDRERRTLDPALYAMLKKELSRPLGIHGGGQAKAPTGTFKRALGTQSRQTATPIPGRAGVPGGGVDLNKYFAGGK